MAFDIFSSESQEMEGFKSKQSANVLTPSTRIFLDLDLQACMCYVNLCINLSSMAGSTKLYSKDV